MALFRIQNDIEASTIITDGRNVLPSINLNSLPPPLLAGSIAYEVTTKTIYYSDGLQWLPVSGGSGVTSGFAFIKLGQQNILTGVSTVMAPWTSAPSPPYNTIAGWNLVGGIYTAPAALSISLNVNISWSANVSNLGTRTLRIMYFDVNTAITTIVKEAATQADANTAVETTQEVSITVRMNLGDQVWVEVLHNAPITLKISAGNHTSVSGSILV